MKAATKSALIASDATRFTGTPAEGGFVDVLTTVEAVGTVEVVVIEEAAP